MSTEKNVASISVTGVAIGEYDTVIYNCHIKEVAPTSREAKAKARPRIAALNAAIAALKAKGVKVDDDCSTAVPQVIPQETHGRDGLTSIAGYIAAYTVAVKSTSFDRIEEVFDDLSELEGTGVKLDFKIKNLTELHDKALLDAKEKLQQQFRKQTDLLDIIDPDKLDLANWDIRYDNSQGAGRGLRQYSASAFLESAGGGDDDEPIKISAGQAVVTCSVSIGLRRLGGALDPRLSNLTKAKPPAFVKTSPLPPSAPLEDPRFVAQGSVRAVGTESSDASGSS